MKTKRAFDATGQKIERLSSDIDSLEKESLTVFSEMEGFVEEQIVTAREIREIEDDIRDMIEEIDEMIFILGGELRPRKQMKDWADESDEEEEKPQRRLWSSLFKEKKKKSH